MKLGVVTACQRRVHPPKDEADGMGIACPIPGMLPTDDDATVGAALDLVASPAPSNTPGVVENELCILRTAVSLLRLLCSVKQTLVQIQNAADGRRPMRHSTYVLYQYLHDVQPWMPGNAAPAAASSGDSAHLLLLPASAWPPGNGRRRHQGGRGPRTAACGRHCPCTSRAPPDATPAP